MTDPLPTFSGLPWRITCFVWGSSSASFLTSTFISLIFPTTLALNFRFATAPSLIPLYYNCLTDLPIATSKERVPIIFEANIDVTTQSSSRHVTQYVRYRLETAIRLTIQKANETPLVPSSPRTSAPSQNPTGPRPQPVSIATRSSPLALAVSASTSPAIPYPAVAATYSVASAPSQTSSHRKRTLSALTRLAPRQRRRLLSLERLRTSRIASALSRISN